MKSGLRLQRQPCNKADDRIINDPLRVELPSLNCEPVGETLAQSGAFRVFRKIFWE